MPLSCGGIAAVEKLVGLSQRRGRADVQPDPIQADAIEAALFDGPIEQEVEREGAFRSVREQARMYDADAGVDERHQLALRPAFQQPIRRHHEIAPALITDAPRS